jgi:3-oxoadipate enol-lactonase
MPFAEIGPNKLYYEDSGGDGPAIVFSHGAFLDHTLWQHQVSGLSPSCRVIAWDERGHGMSQCNGDYDFWDAAGDAVGLLDELGIESAVFAGMSQGGWLSQRVALGHPERARGLVLMGTTVKPLSEQEEQGYGQMAQAWLTIGPVGEIAQAILGIQFAGSDYDGAYYIERWQSKPPADWAGVWNAILNRKEDLSDRLSQIACPVLFIHGTNDAAFPVSVAHEMSGLVADSRGVIEVDGGAHAVGLTHPQAVTPAIAEFMAAL